MWSNTYLWVVLHRVLQLESHIIYGEPVSVARERRPRRTQTSKITVGASGRSNRTGVFVGIIARRLPMTLVSSLPHSLCSLFICSSKIRLISPTLHFGNDNLGMQPRHATSCVFFVPPDATMLLERVHSYRSACVGTSWERYGLE